MASARNATKRNPQKRNAKRDQRERNAIRVLGITAILFGVAALVLIGVKISEGVGAGKNADALLDAYRAQLTPTPIVDKTPIVVPTPTPEPAETDGADTDVEQTNSDADAAAAADANEHRASGADDSVDEGGAYVQPDSPDEVSDLEVLIERIISATDEGGVVGILEIPELDEELPIIGKWSYKLLKISICRYKGPIPNEEGNLVVIGHNYKNGSHFGRLDELSVGSEIFLTDTKTGTRTRYEVYQMKSVAGDAFSALNTYRGACGLTLMTCKDNGTNRLLVRCEQKAAAAANASDSAKP